MKLARLVVTAALLMTAAKQPSPAGNCVAVKGGLRSQVQVQLSQRAVRVISLAREPTWSRSEELHQLVHDKVSVKGGTGDVRLFFPPGLPALHALSRMIDATDYRYEGWPNLDGLFDGCARQIVSVEFFNAQSGRSWPVRFEFENGRVKDVETWERNIVSGPFSSGEAKRKR